MAYTERPDENGLYVDGDFPRNLEELAFLLDPGEDPEQDPLQWASDQEEPDDEEPDGEDLDDEELDEDPDDEEDPGEEEDEERNLYCLLMMKTTKPGCGRPSVFGGSGDAMSYELKLLHGHSAKELLTAYVEQIKSWLQTHPDYDRLELSGGRICQYTFWPKEVLRSRRAAAELLDVLGQEIRRQGSDGTLCEITAFECYADGFQSLKYELANSSARLPCTPADFDTNAIEGKDAWEMLHGEQMDSCNYWNRDHWEIREGADEDGPGFVERVNAELYWIAHEPQLDSFALKYFVGVH